MIIKDGFTGLSSGTGFVTFIDVEDGQDAIKHLHNFDLGGLILKLGVPHQFFIRTCYSLELNRTLIGPKNVDI